MKILITGANGMLAKAIINEFQKDNELILTDKNELDITNKDAVFSFVSMHKPQLIINCAAYTSVDNAESDVDLAKKINVDGSKNLAQICNLNDCALVHISTDYVFDGTLPLNKCYTESDPTYPHTVYGFTKLGGEKAIIENCKKYYIFRTAWLYGDGKNFVRTMLHHGKEKKFVNVVCDQYGSPTFTNDLASIIHQVLNKKIKYGIYHATNLGFTTWYDFAKEIFSLAGINCQVKAITSKEYITPAQRPKNSKLSKDKLLLEGVKISLYSDALRRFLEKEGELM